MAEKKLIGAFEVPPLAGKTDDEIEQIGAQIADEIAAALMEQGEEVETAEAPESE
jgi:hypothetical protein